MRAEGGFRLREALWEAPQGGTEPRAPLRPSRGCLGARGQSLSSPAEPSSPPQALSLWLQLEAKCPLQPLRTAGGPSARVLCDRGVPTLARLSSEISLSLSGHRQSPHRTGGSMAAWSRPGHALGSCFQKGHGLSADQGQLWPPPEQAESEGLGSALPGPKLSGSPCQLPDALALGESHSLALSRPSVGTALRGGRQSGSALPPLRVYPGLAHPPASKLREAVSPCCDPCPESWLHTASA